MEERGRRERVGDGRRDVGESEERWGEREETGKRERGRREGRGREERGG